MTSHIPVELRAAATERANGRCEYCLLSQAGQEATFHVDHVIPRTTGGPTDLDNLALACVGCSLRKAAKLDATDPHTGSPVPLFNPRKDSWSDHFRWRGVVLEGRSPIGRATAEALAMNRPLSLAIREEEVLLGRHLVD